MKNTMVDEIDGAMFNLPLEEKIDKWFKDKQNLKSLAEFNKIKMNYLKMLKVKDELSCQVMLDSLIKEKVVQKQLQDIIFKACYNSQFRDVVHNEIALECFKAGFLIGKKHGEETKDI
jgi:hypothetical protein